MSPGQEGFYDDLFWQEQDRRELEAEKASRAPGWGDSMAAGLQPVTVVRIYTDRFRGNRYLGVLLCNGRGGRIRDGLFLWDSVDKRRRRARYRLARLVAAAGVKEGDSLFGVVGRQVSATVDVDRNDYRRRIVKEYAPSYVWLGKLPAPLADDQATRGPGYGDTMPAGMHVVTVKGVELRTSRYRDNYLRVNMEDEAGNRVSDGLYLWSKEGPRKFRARARLGQLLAATGVPRERSVCLARGKKVLVTVALPPNKEGQRLVRGYALPRALDPDWESDWYAGCTP